MVAMVTCKPLVNKALTGASMLDCQGFGDVSTVFFLFYQALRFKQVLSWKEFKASLDLFLIFLLIPSLVPKFIFTRCIGILVSSMQNQDPGHGCHKCPQALCLQFLPFWQRTTSQVEDPTRLRSSSHLHVFAQYRIYMLSHTQCVFF